MNLQGKYSNAKIKKYPNKYQNVPTSEVIFVNKKSINDSYLKFTNFLERGITSIRNQQIKNIIDTLVNNPSNFDNLFESSDVSIQTPSDLKKVERVKKILKLNCLVPNSSDVVFKGTLINTSERGFQILFTMDNDRKIIYLIDLYHLTIPSFMDRKGNHFDLFEEYEKRKKYKKDIQEILF